MKYTRKTKDEYQILQYYAGYGWEEVCCSDSRLEAKQTLKDYRDNQPEYPVKIKKVRVKITQTGAPK